MERRFGDRVGLADLLYAVLAEFQVQLNEFQSAADNLRKAIRLSEIASEQSELSNRLRDCEERSK